MHVGRHEETVAGPKVVDRFLVLLMIGVIAAWLANVHNLPAEAAISITYRQDGMSPGEALLLGAVGAAFGLDSSVVIRYHSKTGSIEGAVSVAYTSKEGGIDAEMILRERERGTSWEQITRKHKLPPGLQGKWDGHPGKAKHLQKIARRGLSEPDPFEVSITLRFLAVYYDVDEDWIIDWVEEGLSVEDVALVLNLSARAKADPATVAGQRARGESWERLAERYGVSPDELIEPATAQGFGRRGSKGKGNN